MNAPGPMGQLMGCETSLAVAEPGAKPPPGAPVIRSIEERDTVVDESRSVPAIMTCVPRTRPRAAGFQ